MKYRPEIDGLRALAVIPVILFHAGFQSFSGGFVGVDVFFVISGYLITSLILAEQHAGTFTLIGFYERRARRILPALFVVMFVSVFFAWYVMPPSDRKEFSESIMAASAFVSNVYFWRQAGYFDTASETKPLLHTWSLSVEEQYYVLFPLFLLFTWKFGKRLIVELLIFIAIMSFSVAQWGSLNKQAFSFFVLPARGWELLVGALIAFYLFTRDADKPTIKTFSQIGSGLGLLLLTCAIFAFDKHTPFPGVYTLIPTTSTALIIVFATEQTLVGKMLASKVLVGIGLISYSAYLWHYPLFAFARHVSIGEPSNMVLLALIAATLCLAYLSWKFVETPFRQRQRIERNKIFFYGTVSSVFFVAVGFLGHWYKGFESKYDLPPSLSTSLLMSHRQAECFDKEQVHTRNDWMCALGNKDHSRPSFIVLGDSHALSFLDAFDKAAESENVTGAFSAVSSCPPLLEIHPLNVSQEVNNCNLLNERIFEYVRTNEIKKVFLVARWTYYTDGGYDSDELLFLGLSKDAKPSKDSSRQAFEVALQNTIEAYQKIGARVYVVSQIPQQQYDAKKLYHRSYALHKTGDEFNGQLRSLSISRQDHHRLQSYVASRFKFHESEEKITVISFDHIFCNGDKCLVGDHEKSYYHDDDHLSSAGSLLVVEDLKKFLSLPLLSSRSFPPDNP